MEHLAPCQKQHTAALAAMLARAFLRDPLYEYVFPDVATRQALAALDIELLIRYGLRYGEVIAAPLLAGCAIWLPPGETDFTEERMAKVGMLDSAALIGEKAHQRMNKFIVASEVSHRRLVPQPHWYLVVLGVEPPEHGRGIGSALLAAGLQKADAGKYPVYLETLNPNNIRFYQKHGFNLRAEEDLSEGQVSIYYMVRDPIG